MARKSNNKDAKEQIVRQIIETEQQQEQLQETSEKLRHDLEAALQDMIDGASDDETWKATKTKMATVAAKEELLTAIRDRLLEQLHHELNQGREDRLKAIPEEISALYAKKEEIWAEFMRVYAEASVLAWHLWGSEDIYRPFIADDGRRISFDASVEKLKQDSGDSIHRRIENLQAEARALEGKEITAEDVEKLIDQARAKSSKNS